MSLLLSPSVNSRFGCARNQKHVALTVSQALTYCSVLAISYVGSLYILTPAKIRKLDRDNAQHIQWRSMATLVVCAVALVSYSWLFCLRTADQPTNDGTPGFWGLIISVVRRDALAAAVVLLHTLLLYVGPLVQNILAVCSFIERRDGAVTMQRFREVSWSINVDPFISAIVRPRNDSERWMMLRNYFVAPLTEEIIFRSCMVPALWSTGKMNAAAVSFVTPLFFGFAHAHHAFMKLRQGRSLLHVMIETTFQFAYTTLFGSYASYVFLQTGTLCAVVACHTFCNAMGLPDLTFMRQYSPLYAYRLFLLLAHVIGLFCFLVGIKYIPTAYSQ